MVVTAPLAALAWTPSWRLVASRFPPVGLFDRVAAPADLDTVFAIESLTNARLRQETGELALVPAQDRVSGPGTTPIMAAFTHCNGQGSRFTDGSYGVYYAARGIDTAIVETAFHRARFLAATHEAPMQFDMRSYAADIVAEFHDIRGAGKQHAALYDPDPAAYGAAQAFARRLRTNGSNGIAYDSVRDAGGECVAVFKPRVIAPVVQGPHYCYVWDGQRIAGIYVKSAYYPAGTAPP
ncbi:MAG: RES family NAD+ phosphorylase [Gammaproteobacteria bacterium]|nr:RES family NAD+ phosphorylase [Gammaproteobacteria bacterium]